MAEPRRLRLVHDVLDAQLCDRRKEHIGRVDEVELRFRADGSLHVAEILIGGPARVERLGWWARVLASFINRIVRAEPGISCVPFEKVRAIGDTIVLDVDGDALLSSHLEVWLRDHVVCRLPWASGDRK